MVASSIRTYKYRLFPTRRQAEALEQQLGEACRLYNAAIQERRDAWRMSRTRIDFYTQDKQLKEIRAADDISIPSFNTARHVLRRIDLAFQAFFRRVKAGQKPGYPRFRSRTRFDSLTFTIGHGAGIDNRLRLAGIGHVKGKWHRAIPEVVSLVHVKREAGRWYGCFVCEVEQQRLLESYEAIGIDVGLTSFATLSTGEAVENPRYYRQAERRLRLAQRRIARRKRGSHRRNKAVRLLQRAHARIKNQRTNFHHQLSRRLVDRYGFIAVEDLNVKGLASSKLAKSVNDAGWSSFMFQLTSKAESAGRELVRVDPRGTSQTCLCGASVPKRLSDREHVCTACGLVADRDHVSAQVILQRARTEPSGANVAGRTACVA